MPLAPRTIDAYRADWADFEAWCAVRGEVSLPATGPVIARPSSARNSASGLGIVMLRPIDPFGPPDLF